MKWPDDIDFKNDITFNSKFQNFKNRTIFFIIDFKYDFNFYFKVLKKIILDPDFN